MTNLKLTKKECEILGVSVSNNIFALPPSSYCVVCTSSVRVVFVERFPVFRRYVRESPSDYDDRPLFQYTLTELY